MLFGGKEKEVEHEGVSKKQNEITRQRFESALIGSEDMAANRGFHMCNGQMVTHKQQKLGLSAS